MQAPNSAVAGTHRRLPRRRSVVAALLIILSVGLFALAITDHPRVWPYRNTLEYYVLYVWETITPRFGSVGRGTIAGVIRDGAGQPVVHARVLVAARDGTAYSAESDATGHYRIADVPAASYVPVAGAPGFDNATLRRAGLFGTTVRADATTRLDVTLERVVEPPIARAENFRLGPSRTLSVEAPLRATAEERPIHFEVAGRPNQTSLYYTPIGGPATLPTLLAVYPGPADLWVSVSLPLAQAGFAVIAVGPAYALDLEPDVDDLVRVIAALEAGAFPRADPERIGVLGGSYSSLHIFRLAQRHPTLVDAILVLGPATDLFELRRQFEAGTFFPPFDLDKALIALGFPDRAPERYWRYSARYHARSFAVPIMLIHSKIDEVVPFTQSQLLADELERLGKSYELHILEDMGHYLVEPEHTPALGNLFETTTGFFARELRSD